MEKGFTVHKQRNGYYIDSIDFLDMRGKKSADRANQDYEQTMEVEDTLNENYGSDSQQRNDTDSDDRTMDVKQKPAGRRNDLTRWIQDVLYQPTILENGNKICYNMWSQAD